MGRPSHSAYAPLATDHDLGSAAPSPPQSRAGSARAHSPPKRTAPLDAALARWTHAISDKMARKKLERRRQRAQKHTIDGRDKDQAVPTIESVFEPWTAQPFRQNSSGEMIEVGSVGGKLDKGKGKGKAEAESEVDWLTLDHDEPMTKNQFDQLVNKVEEAIQCSVQPRLNAKGSSGSYFAKDASGKTVAIFKPKDEEPYGSLNPKFTKWVHRVFLSRVIPFGRACLIPQLSYLSEAAASLLDYRLRTYIVPRTEVVSLSSPAFYYSYIDRERAEYLKKGSNKGRPLPEKPGSFQVFMRGFQDASEFLKVHPYPGRPLSQTLDQPKRTKKVDVCLPFRCLCGRAGDEREGQSGEEEGEFGSGWGWGGEDGGAEDRERRERKATEFKWTPDTMTSFRLQLEKLVILDFLIRNTDRGLDNFMIKACTCADGNTTPLKQSTTTSVPPSAQPQMSQTGLPPTDKQTPHMHIAAIDNSLAFPHRHPVGWRNYTYGWLFLPVSLIGQPFSESTRNHFLPLLTSPEWWAQTTLELRQLFALDPDFKESMFEKQMAVMKGQAFNVVASLRHEADGPLEMCRRTKRLVHTELKEVRDDDATREKLRAACLPPRHRRRRSSAVTVTSTGSPVAEARAMPIASPMRPTSPLLPSSVSRFVGGDSAVDDPTPDSVASPSRPMPMHRVSAEMAFPAKNGAGRARSNPTVPTLAGRALSAAQIPKAEYGSVSGVSVLKALDRAEADEKGVGRRTGANLRRDEDDFDEDDDDEDDEDEDENDEREGEGEGGEGREVWAIQSEGAQSTEELTFAERARQTFSFDLDRTEARSNYFDDLPAFEAGRAGRSPHLRSGSVGRLPRASPRPGKRGGHGRYSSTTSSAGHRAWSDVAEDGEEDDEEEPEEGDLGVERGKMVVGVERVELVHENATFSWF